MGWKVIDSEGKARGGTGKKPCRLKKTAEAYIRMLEEQYPGQKFRVVST